MGVIDMSDQVDEKRTLALPDPIFDGREYAELDKLTEQYERLTSPGFIGTVAK